MSSEPNTTKQIPMAMVCRCSYFHNSNATKIPPANTGNNGMVICRESPITIPAIRQMTALTNGVLSNTLLFISIRFNAAKIVFSAEKYNNFKEKNITEQLQKAEKDIHLLKIAYYSVG